MPDKRTALTPAAELRHLSPERGILHRADELGLRCTERADGGWRLQCPAHDDHDPSLVLSIGDGGRVLLRCHAGCDFKAVIAALGLPADLLRGGRAWPQGERQEIAQKALRRHDKLMQDIDRMAELAEMEGWSSAAMEGLYVGRYGRDWVTIPERDHRGRIVGMAHFLPRHHRGVTVVRAITGRYPLTPAEQKRVRGHHHEGQRGCVYAAEQMQADTVLIVEGSGKAVAAMSLGHDVIGYPSASVGFKRSWRPLVKDRDVYVIADPDDTGRRAAQATAETVLPVAASVAIVDLDPNNLIGLGDIADILRANGVEKTREIIEKALLKSKALRKPPRGRPPSQRELAERYLSTNLGDGLWHLSAEIENNSPVSNRTLDRTRNLLEVESRRVGSQWQMRLPQALDSSLTTRTDLAFLRPSPFPLQSEPFVRTPEIVETFL